jgi:hypothetical protein
MSNKFSSIATLNAVSLPLWLLCEINLVCEKQTTEKKHPKNNNTFLIWIELVVKDKKSPKRMLLFTAYLTVS